MCDKKLLLYKPNINLPPPFDTKYHRSDVILHVFFFLNLKVHAECIIMVTGVCMIILCHFTIDVIRDEPLESDLVGVERDSFFCLLSFSVTLFQSMKINMLHIFL